MGVAAGGLPKRAVNPMFAASVEGTATDRPASWAMPSTWEQIKDRNRPCSRKPPKPRPNGACCRWKSSSNSAARMAYVLNPAWFLPRGGSQGFQG